MARGDQSNTADVMFKKGSIQQFGQLGIDPDIVDTPSIEEPYTPVETDVSIEEEVPLEEPEADLNEETDESQIVSPLAQHQKDIDVIIEHYVKAIKLLRKQLDEGWMPLKRGEKPRLFDIDPPEKFTVKQWEEKVRETDRLVNQIDLLIRG